MHSDETVNSDLKTLDLIIDENFNLFDVLLKNNTIDNPYPVYHKLRNYDPVFLMKSPTGFLSENIWIITRYEDISNVLKNKKFGRGNKFGKIKEDSKYYANLNSLTKMRQHWVTFLDPPEHTRMRNFINKAMSVKIVNEMEPVFNSVAEYLAEKLNGEAELISEFAYPLAAISLAEFFGIPREDRDMLDKWALQIVRTLDVVTKIFTQEDLEKIYKCADEIKDYFGKIVDEKTKNPKDDMISRLITISEGEDKMSKEEIISTLVLLTMDAHEAPKNLIGNGMFALLNNPEQKELLIKEPGLIENAVDEILRYDSPAQFTGRRTNETETIGGKQIDKGLQIICMLGAGNRDPDKFENPDTFDITRENVIPLSFGGGIHFCAGAGMGRLEANTGINILLKKFPEIKLKNEVYHYHNYLHSRGLEKLDVQLK